MKLLPNSITFKYNFSIAVLLTLFAVIISTIGIRAFNDALYDQYEEGAFGIAESAARFIDPESLDEYEEEGGTSEEYMQSWKQLDRVCNGSGAMFIYVIRPNTPDYGQIRFLFSTVNHNSDYTPYEIGFLRDTTNEEYRQKYRALYEGETDREVLVLESSRYSRDEFHITAMIPLKNSEGKTEAILCVQRQTDIMDTMRDTFSFSVLRTLLIMVGLVIILQSVYLHHELIGPVQTITKEAARFASENQPARQKLETQILNTDEIGVLANAIDRMEEQVAEYIENLTTATAEKERITAELSLGARIQEAMIPQDFPPFPDRKEFDLYASMKPARLVGGDFYDFFLIDEDHLGLVMSDVSGKGIPAALFMMISKTIVQSCAMLGRGAAEILTKTNEALCSNNKVDMFVTAWMGILEISTGKLTAASAGHEYPALRQGGGEFVLLRDRHGLPIGAMEDVKYHEYTIQLQPGDAIFLYTDGVPEATDVRDAMLGTGGMLEILNREPDVSPEKMIQNMHDGVNEFVGSAEQFDDMTMMYVVYHGPADPEQKE